MIFSSEQAYGNGNPVSDMFYSKQNSRQRNHKIIGEDPCRLDLTPQIHCLAYTFNPPLDLLVNYLSQLKSKKRLATMSIP